MKREWTKSCVSWHSLVWVRFGKDWGGVGGGGEQARCFHTEWQNEGAVWSKAELGRWWWDVCVFARVHRETEGGIQKWQWWRVNRRLVEWIVRLLWLDINPISRLNQMTGRMHKIGWKGMFENLIENSTIYRSFSRPTAKRPRRCRTRFLGRPSSSRLFVQLCPVISQNFAFYIFILIFDQFFNQLFISLETFQ